jgi:glutamate synthase (NADPH/NADH) small chain
LTVPGRELKGVHLAMEYLTQQNRLNLGDKVPADQIINAKGKHVIILGGGDTGADCLGTALRQGASLVSQFELLPEPPKERSIDMPWPTWPMILRISSAHEEAIVLQEGKDKGLPAKIRDYSINTKKFAGKDGRVTTLHGIRLEWVKGADGRMGMKEIPGSDFEIPCDLCFLAMGFVSPEHDGPINQLGLDKDPRGNVKVNADYMTNQPGVFAAGDMRRGQSLVVWAISEGRQAARGVDKFLMGQSDLPYIKLF